MKKQYIELVLIIGISFVLIWVLKPNQWDVMVYSLMSFVLLLSVGQEIYRIIKKRKGIYVEGVIVDDGRIEDNEINKAVEFISSTDNKKYTIKYLIDENSVKVVKNEKTVKVWVNVKNPTKSLVVNEFDGLIFLSLAGKILFAAFFIVMVIISW